MDLGYALVKAVVQGATEFLPVSSSAHLIITRELWQAFGSMTGGQLPTALQDECFDVWLHLGTLLAVLVYFWADLKAVAMAAFLPTPSSKTTELITLDPKKLPLHLVVSTVVTAVFSLAVMGLSHWVMKTNGWLSPEVDHVVDYYRANPVWVGFHLTLTGSLLWWIEGSQSVLSKKGPMVLTSAQATWIGLAQGCAAVFRGISRSGSTISAGLMVGLDRTTATRYAFLMSIPALLMAASYEGLKAWKAGSLFALDFATIGWGIAAAAIVGYLCVAFMLRWVATRSLRGFAVYCWLVGFAVIAWQGNLFPF
ncbi:MAG: undecaprenyl-diphosphate phosphatase [Vampirovibrionales bacterium]|nr:undecaprenyl-diphosphate phosphatase [Vampirovibrionales bacterium]